MSLPSGGGVVSAKASTERVSSDGRPMRYRTGVEVFTMALTFDTPSFWIGGACQPQAPSGPDEEVPAPLTHQQQSLVFDRMH